MPGCTLTLIIVTPGSPAIRVSTQRCGLSALRETYSRSIRVSVVQGSDTRAKLCSCAEYSDSLTCSHIWLATLIATTINRCGYFEDSRYGLRLVISREA